MVTGGRNEKPPVYGGFSFLFTLVGHLCPRWNTTVKMIRKWEGVFASFGFEDVGGVRP